MDSIHKRTLGLVWGYGLDGTDPVRELSRFLNAGEVLSRLNRLVRDGMLDGDLRVTDRGRAEITVVMCGGVFDVIHHGHVHALDAAGAMGDVLCVVVASDKTAQNAKSTLHDACTRRRIVGAIGAVDVCIVGHDSDIFASVGAVRPDVIALGYDQTHHTDHIRDGCRRLGLDTKVVRLDSPVPNVSSSDLKGRVSLDAM